MANKEKLPRSLLERTTQDIPPEKSERQILGEIKPESEVTPQARVYRQSNSDDANKFFFFPMYEDKDQNKPQVSGGVEAGQTLTSAEPDRRPHSQELQGSSPISEVGEHPKKTYASDSDNTDSEITNNLTPYGSDIFEYLISKETPPRLLRGLDSKARSAAINWLATLHEKDDPKLNLFLAEHLHPTLRPPSELLEYAVLRMRFATETLMARHGMEVSKAFTELNRLSEAATEIYMMTAVLARASRAYCIGLRNAELEMKLAGCFTENSKLRVQKLIKDIDNGEFLNLDHYIISFGRRVLEPNVTEPSIMSKPTDRVFW